MNQNPLLIDFSTPFQTPPFHLIKTEHYLPAMEKAIEEAKAEIESLKGLEEKPTFDNTIEALEQSGEKLNRIAEIFFNLNSAETDDEMQKLAQTLSAMLQQYQNDIILDQDLFRRVKSVWDKRLGIPMDKEQSRLLEKTYKSFTRNGALLDEDKKARLRDINTELAQLTLKFGEHVLAETNKYQLVVEDKARIAGLPPYAVEAAHLEAEERGLGGKWVFTLQFPSYMAVMTYADDRELRKELFMAYATKCCKGDELDNSDLIRKIVALRDERAKLLGYPSHADFVLEERMAESPRKVTDFLEELLEIALPAAKQELAELSTFAKEEGGPEKLERWDTAYYAEKLKKARYQIDDELLKPYFKLENVIDGVFMMAERLFDIRFVREDTIPKYHADVQTFEVTDPEGKHIGVFYADFFPRKGKRGGAWMTAYRGQSIRNGRELRPHVSIVCNFTKPGKTTPSLLTLDEVTTLFHEFGHALHGLLAEGKYESITGTSVYWDFVELPSQIMENWVTEKECLDLFARHYETGELIPEELVQKIKDSSNFMEGMQTIRQIGFGLLDMAYHGAFADLTKPIQQFEQEILGRLSLLDPVPGTCMSTAFSHIFQGGYSAGYYSYKWAEVLDADAFEYFKEEGIFNEDVARAFRKHILAAGGVEHPSVLYRRFRGREANPEALMRRSGLLKKAG